MSSQIKLANLHFILKFNNLKKIKTMKIKNLLLLITGSVIILSSCGQTMTGNAKIKTDLDTLSYALGADIGHSLKNLSISEINYDAFFNGLSDVFEEKDLKVDEEKIKPYINNYITKLRTEKAAKNLEEGKAFLEENKKKEGVIVTESGLQYEIITEGTGKSPGATDVVRCHYHGTLINDTVFDSSVERGDTAEFALNRVIPGWTEGLQLMKEGAKYKFYIPTELAYGQRVRPGGVLEANMALIFEVELFEVKAPEAPTKKVN